MSLERKILELAHLRQTAQRAGGESRVRKQHEQGKYTARERLEKLLDEGSFEEFDAFVTHRCTDFGYDYGVLISGGPLDRCLARAIFVVDGAGKIKHVEYCTEIAEHPNYDAVLAAAKG